MGWRAGDFDQDGFADLAIGVPGEDIGTIGSAGAVIALYGSAAGLTSSGAQLLTQAGGATELNDAFGGALAAGDFDDDGFADLAASVSGEDVGSVPDAGAVSVLPGSPGGLSTVGGRLFTQVGGAVETEDFFGNSLATGDFDQDGFADLVAGARFEDVGTARERWGGQRALWLLDWPDPGWWAAVHPGGWGRRAPGLLRQCLGGG